MYELLTTLGLDGPWRNDACMGYCLMAMDRVIEDETVKMRVMSEFHELFDCKSVEEAAAYLKGREGCPY